MEILTEDEESDGWIAEEPLPKANLSPTANPSVYLDKMTGILYYLQQSPIPDHTKLVKLNETA